MLQKLLAGLLILGFISLNLSAEASVDQISKFVDSVKYSGNAGLSFTLAGQVVTIDPVTPKFKDRSDLVLITHDHGDHFSYNTARRISDEKSMIVGSKVVIDAFFHSHIDNLRVAKAGESFQLGNLKVEMVPAYNIASGGTQKPHLKEYGWVGYILEGDGMRVYVTGDTGRIPEMQDLRVDLIFLPLGQTYTMSSVAEAVQVVHDVHARVAVPIHYGLYEGTKEDALQFAALLEGTVKVILKPRL